MSISSDNFRWGRLVLAVISYEGSSVVLTLFSAAFLALSASFLIGSALTDTFGGTFVTKLLVGSVMTSYMR